MRIFLIAVILLLAGCKSSPKKNHDFTFFKWNLHESYYLKFNSSDTLYCVDAYGKEETSFAILNKDQKETILTVLDTIVFPKNETFEDYNVDDGATYAFVVKDKKHLKKLTIHGNEGPKKFWKFGEVLEEIKLNLQFVKTNKKIDLKEINKMVLVEVPFVVDTTK